MDSMALLHPDNFKNTVVDPGGPLGRWWWVGGVGGWVGGEGMMDPGGSRPCHEGQWVGASRP